MEQNMEYAKARDLLLRSVRPVKTEAVPLEESAGRVLAGDWTAAENVPAFDRSPYDGYAFRAADSAGASNGAPVTLAVLEEIPAGAMPRRTITPGTAARVMTGAPIPPGADAVVMYEKTRFTRESVALFAPAAPGENIVRAGEDVRAGALLARDGTVIDPGLTGTLAAQGVVRPPVYRRPRVGLISTGSELACPGGEVPAGKIRDSNRYTLAAALQRDGCIVEALGAAGDSAAAIEALIRRGLDGCDMVLLTGGVSAGDHDRTPAAMEQAGAALLARGVALKPGMACAYGLASGKLVCGLSGNPAAALANYFAVVRPAVHRLAGRCDCLPEPVTMTLAGGFAKKSKTARLLWGRLALEDGAVKIHLSAGQGNAVISGVIGCNAAAIVPANSGPLPAGTILKGFLL